MNDMKGKMKIVVRKFEEKKDREEVEEMERRCEVGPTGKLSLFTNQLGDPISRIRHSPAFLMLVAEKVVVDRPGEGGGIAESSDERRKSTEQFREERERKEIIGVVRGCIKTVTCGKKLPRNGNNENGNNVVDQQGSAKMAFLPVYTKLAYILGLRVSPSHRRMGVGLKLVVGIEKWFRDNGAGYSYMATESDNTASVQLFTGKCGYSKFRTPSILVQPVFAHTARVSPAFTILKLSPSAAEGLYRRLFSATEFFPDDIGDVLKNSLNLGSFLAVPRATSLTVTGGDGLPGSWAVMSVWNCKEVWRLEVRGASRVTRGLAKTTRLLDRALPWLRIPSVPEVFGQFGFHFMYGVGGEGPAAVRMVRALCGYAHNLAKKSGCAVVATEVAGGDPLRLGIPHWKRLSCAEDLWCIKRLVEDYSDGSVGDWTKSPPGSSIFVDPREF